MGKAFWGGTTRPGSLELADMCASENTHLWVGCPCQASLFVFHSWSHRPRLAAASAGELGDFLRESWETEGLGGIPVHPHPVLHGRPFLGKNQ